MKKPIIKNWTKYWASTLAVSGMLVVGACGDSNQTAENEIETAETELVEPAREEVANLETDADDLQTTGTENEAEYVADEETQQVEYEQTSATPADSENTATSFGNMDQHVEEHQNVNNQIRETLTDNNNQLNQDQQNQDNFQAGEEGDFEQTRGENPGQNMDNNNMENDQNIYDRQSNTNIDQAQPSDNLNNEQNTEATAEDEDEMFFEDKEPAEDEREDAQDVEKGDKNEMFFEDEEPADKTMNQEQKAEEAAEEESEMFFEDKETAEEEREDAQDVEKGDNNEMFFEDEEGTEQTQPSDEQNTSNVYEKQSNTNLAAEPDAYLIILEERRADYDAQNQQAMDDIVNAYNERRESMRGQIDEKTGAYVSPEVDPQPKMGISELMNQVHENLEYPQNAAAAEIEGTVFVNFIVDENGNITEANAVEDVIVPVESMQYTQPLNPTKFSEQEIEETKKEMKKEAVKAVKSTSGQWEPATQNGQEVRAEVQLPVVFSIENIGGTDEYTPEILEKEEK